MLLDWNSYFNNLMIGMEYKGKERMWKNKVVFWLYLI